MDQFITSIIKRDGRATPFSVGKIELAIVKANNETHEFDFKEARRLSEIVRDILEKVVGIRKEPVTVEQVQDTVEQVLMAGGHFKTAKAYILYRAEHAKIRKVETALGVKNDLRLSINQLKVIERRYLVHDLHGKATETPGQMFRRVAHTLAGVEKTASKKKKWEEVFYEVMTKFEFLPGGRTLNNAGTPQNQLANCFVIPVEDNMEAIFDAVKWTALVHQSGGGSGFSFSKLRPRGDVVKKSSGGFSTGPVSFIKVFDIATRQVMQGGKQRGANMGILAVNHPDILEFINCKTEEGEISNFNISVGATDAFMKAVEQDKEFALINPRTNKTVRSISARLLMDQIVSLAWRTGDPGMIYWDAINRNNPLLDSVGPIYATNPCITGDCLIQTNNGQLSVEKLIFKLQTGEKILAMTHTGNFKRVIGWSRNGKKKVYKIVVDGSHIKATADHKFYSKKEFVKLSQLKVGDTVVFRQTKDIGFTNVEIQSIEEVGEEEVYDLQVEREHSFIANGFVVHNCGEQPLHPFDSCNLGSINLAAFVRDGLNQKDKNRKPELDWDRLGFVTRTAVRMLDNVIDACKYPLPQITKTVQENRRIGLGVMGWADLLLRMGIPYNSDEGVKLAEKVMKFVQEQSWISSEQLAKEKGAFPKWKGSWFAKGFDPATHKYSHKNNPRKLRNVAITTIAPTGTISMAAECSSGIEPVFALSYNKNVVDSAGLTYVNAYFEKALRAEAGNNGKFNEIVAKVAETGSVHNLDDVSDKIQKIFVTAHDVSWEWHVKMQAAFQKYTDNAVSKTINFPSTATVEEVRGAYILAWKFGCKGITVYRDKSKGTQVLSLSNGASSIENKDKTDSKTKHIMQSQIRIIPLADRTDFASIVRQEIQKGDTIDISQEEEEKCPECGTTMNNQEGCNLCPSCGYSKCKL